MNTPLGAELCRQPRRCEDLQTFKSYTIEITCNEWVINKSRVHCTFFPKCKTDSDRPSAGGAATAVAHVESHPCSPSGPPARPQ